MGQRHFYPCGTTMAPVLPLPSGLPVLYSEPPALDLMNTRLLISGTWVDLLDDPTARSEWLAHEATRVGFDADDAAAVTDEDAQALRALRVHVAEAVDAARQAERPPRRAVTAINDTARAAPTWRGLQWEETDLVATTHRDGPLAARLSAGFAEAAVQLLGSPDVLKVRRCEAPACVVLFLGSNPRRRWCSPDVCGNRARVARYYVRHKAPAQGA